MKGVGNRVNIDKDVNPRNERFFRGLKMQWMPKV